MARRVSWLVGCAAVLCVLFPRSLPAQGSGSSTLVITSNAACAVFVDGEGVAQLSAGGVHKLTVAAGEHVVSAADQAGRQWQQVVSVSGDQKVLQIEFGPAPAMPAPAPAQAVAAPPPPAAPAPAPVQPPVVSRSDLRVRVDGEGAIDLISKLNDHGRGKGMHFTLSTSDYHYRIVIHTEGFSTADLLFGGGADSAAVVMTPDCDVLFVVARSGRMTQGGAMNAVSKELIKKFEKQFKATGVR